MRCGLAGGSEVWLHTAGLIRWCERSACGVSAEEGDLQCFTKKLKGQMEPSASYATLCNLWVPSSQIWDLTTRIKCVIAEEGEFASLPTLVLTVSHFLPIITQLGWFWNLYRLQKDLDVNELNLAPVLWKLVWINDEQKTFLTVWDGIFPILKFTYTNEKHPNIIFKSQ